MGGIAGWIAFDSDLTRKPETIAAMTAAVAHRGPDGSGTYVRRHVALGHRRLAVVDPVGSAQPMRADTPAGEVVLVYSGEIYNCPELRTELTALGHSFDSSGDTEVLLRGYLQWGDAVVDHLNGMFAFAIWDERVEKLVIARDRMGVKPLYFYPTPDGVLIGSEPKVILAHPLVRKVIDTDSLRELFAITKPPGWAIWKGMAEVRPGTMITVDRRGLHSRTYWKLTPQVHTDDQQTTVARVRELLEDIVDRQLRADVPVSVPLSGGLDSSVVTALAAARLDAQGRKLRTFSANYQRQESIFTPDELRDNPDSPFVREMADLLRTVHTDVMVDVAEHSAPDARRAIVGAADVPLALADLDSSLYLFLKSVRAESTVALAGTVADELFGGYRWFFDEESVQADTFAWLAYRSAYSGDRLAELAPHMRARLDVPGFIHDQYKAAVGEVEQLGDETPVERRMREMCHIHLTRLGRIHLFRMSRASMALGLEVREPFCDHRLVEYVYNTPWAMKSFDGREKSILRHATADLLPESVLWRTKSPYPSTQDPRYAEAMQRQLRGLLAQPDNAVFEFFDRQWVQDGVDVAPDRMPGNVRAGLDRVLNLNQWLELYQPEIVLD
ncbi:asparagine synthase (glutamine-hydrolyzing) [Nocardia yamanashiensis]|uniref:asparagine synthase (glutamine-hydrolyzing) n=1 Tax=Nocardia yamanashiensis TaxID=209247 RepID=UPI00082CED4C|nr:asparagine synthase (glutamine-hydrolyzing) [Nocardia yamanashiensis]